MEIGVRLGEEADMSWSRRSGCQARPFIYLFIFGDRLFLAGKTVRILAKTFFLRYHLFLTEKSPQSNSRLIKIWVKFVY